MLFGMGRAARFPFGIFTLGDIRPTPYSLHSFNARDAMTGRVASWRAMSVAFLSTLALAGCARGPETYSATSPSVPANFSQFSQLAGPADQSNSARRLAISHNFILRLPSAEVEATQKKHLAECSRLGCTIMQTQLDRSSEGRINARASVRIAPDAYAAFVTVIAALPSEVIGHSESAEDKTLPLLDVEKRLEVKSALRDRLTAMLRDSSARSVADVVAIEKELAEVQGEIEAAVAQRDYLRTQVDTVRVDIAYNGQPALIGGVDLSPISFALSGSGRTIVASVAALISFIAAVAPWLPLIALLGWIARRLRLRWKARKAQA
jgi:Domain of unknown function (DUF4349)